jgi:hypothetical protein
MTMSETKGPTFKPSPSLVASAKPENTPQGINPPQPSQPRNPDDKQGVVAESTFVPRGPISSVYNRAPAVLDPTTAATGKWPNAPQSEGPPQRLEPSGNLQVDMPAVKHAPVGMSVGEYHYSGGEVGQGTAPRFDELPENYFGRKENQ